MAGPVKCVWYDRAPKIKRELRRYANDRDCPVHMPGRCACCDVFVPYDIIEWHEPIIAVQEGPPRDDPRWPTECDRCGYKFLETDHWQVFTDAIYRNSETGQEFFMRELPVGAMYNSHWLPDHHKGPDGMALTVVLPDRTPWVIDGSAYDNGRAIPKAWTRTGTIPNISVTPSILTPRYHGWLKAGVLHPC